MSYIVERIIPGENIDSFVVLIEKAKEGLIPIRKEITRHGKKFSQTFWIKPKDLRNMQMNNAMNFMEGMVKAQTYFKSCLDASSRALPDAAAAVYDKMMKTGKLTKRVGALEVKIADYVRQNQVSGDNLLAAIHSRPESEIPSAIKTKVNALYKKVTTSNFGKELQLTVGKTEVGKVRAIQETKPYDWSKEKWSSKFKEIISKKISEVKSIFSARKKGTNIVKEIPEAKKEKIAESKKQTEKHLVNIERKMKTKKKVKKSLNMWHVLGIDF